MKSTSFCLNYASSVSFLSLFPREAIAGFCVTAFESHHSHLCSCLSHPHPHFLRGELMKASFKEGGKAPSLQYICSRTPVLTGVSGRKKKDVKRGSSQGKGEQSLLHFSEALDEHITNPYFSLCRCKKQAPVLKSSNICKQCQSQPWFQQLQSSTSQFTATIIIKPQEIQVSLQPAFPCPHTRTQCLPTISQFLWLLPTQDCHFLGILIPYLSQNLNAAFLTWLFCKWWSLVVLFCAINTCGVRG